MNERWTLRLIIITPLAVLAISAAVITSFYIERMNVYFQESAAQYLAEYVSGEKRQGELFVQDIELLGESTVEHLDENVKKELDQRLELAQNAAENIYNKYHEKLSKKAMKERIIDLLSAMTCHGENNCVFVTDYEGKNIYSSKKELIGKNISSYSDVDGRAIVLEEIQMVRKHGEGYIETRLQKETGIQTIKVKDFGHFEWFIGTGVYQEKALQEAKNELLELVVRAPKDRSGGIVIFENNRALFISEENESKLSVLMLTKMQEETMKENGWVELPQENAYIYIRYFEPFNWHIVYGFNKANFDLMLQDQQQKVKSKVDAEVKFVVAAFLVIALLMALLTFIVSRRIIKTRLPE